MKNVTYSRKMKKIREMSKLSKFDYIFLIGLLPVCINIVSSIYKSSEVNWHLVSNEAQTSKMSNTFFYYFGHNISSNKFIAIVSILLIVYSVFMMIKNYKLNVSKLKAKN